jgi:RHS repeat-associated protein
LVEQRSYDPFGKRRDPVWGQPVPASFASLTTLGFTGHESDDDLGLVNMKGRMFDPKVGRFLTTDPIVSAPHFGQSWNPYSYVLNNPLNYVDPSGFAPGYEEPPVDPEYAKNPEVQRILAAGCLGLECGRPPPEQVEGSSEAAQVGAVAPPVDVGTTGSASGYVPQPVTTSPSDWTQHRVVQAEGGFLAGLSLGIVPFAGVGQQLLDAAEVLPHGTPHARAGLAIGQMVGGVISLAGGLTGEVLGGIASTTGIGAALGVPAIVVSSGLVVGGAGNIAAGIRGLLTTGSGSTGSQGTAPAAEAGPVHGNDLNTTKPAQGYSLRDRDTGAVLKYGETTLDKGRYTSKYLEKHNAEMVFEAKGTKAEMHKWQNEKILKYKAANNGERPPLNKSDW